MGFCQRKRDIKKLRERVEEKNGASAMRFYDLPISEERKKDLKDIVALKRRMVPHIDLEKRFTDLDKISDTFNVEFILLYPCLPVLAGSVSGKFVHVLFVYSLYVLG